MKAVSRFKALLHHPSSLMRNSILGEPSRIVEPPSAIIEAGVHSLSKTPHDRTIQSDGSIGQRVSSTFDGLRHPLGKTGSSLRNISSAPQTAPVDSADGTHDIYRHAAGHLSHAHDTSHEPIFLGIGASSPVDAGDNNFKEDFVAENLIVSGSPEGTDFDLFHNAYHEKLQKIHSTTGENTVTYLTRRVEQQSSDQDQGGNTASSTNPSEKKTASRINLVAAVKRLKNKDNLEGQPTNSEHAHATL